MDAAKPSFGGRQGHQCPAPAQQLGSGFQLEVRWAVAHRELCLQVWGRGDSQNDTQIASYLGRKAKMNVGSPGDHIHDLPLGLASQYLWNYLMVVHLREKSRFCLHFSQEFRLF